MAEFDRILPHSPEAEQTVLGAILSFQAWDQVEGALTEEHFFEGRHARIYRSMQLLAEQGTPIDLVTLVAKLQEQNELGDIGGVSYLAEIANSVPSAANITHYAGILKERTLHRQIIREAKKQLDAAWSTDNLQATIASMQITAASLADQATASRDFRPISEIAMETYEQIEQRWYLRSDNAVTGVASGFADLDRMTTGFQRSDLIIVAARPSVGKTAFALNIADNAGFEGKNVAFVSLEMSATQIVQRMLSANQNIDANRLRTGYLESEDWEKLTMSVGSLSSSNIFIDDTPAQTAIQIAGKCRRLNQLHRLDLILIDYLQLISGSSRRSNRQEEVTDISRMLKAIARELDVPVIALSQLSRAVEQRQDKRPMLSDLRESGAIEQDADIVAFLYRDDYYDKESDKKNIIEIIIAKQRNGPVGTVELAFLKHYNKFVSLDRTQFTDQPPPPEKDKYIVPDMYRQPH